MIAVVICALALVASFWAGRRSLVQGLTAVIATGYLYGILRANVPHPASHFFFDCAMIGFLLSQSWSVRDPSEFKRTGTLRLWTFILMGWPMLVALLPFQPLLVTLVGLRGNIFFLPVLLFASQLNSRQWLAFTYSLASLNLIAFSFAAAEYVLGIERFYPRGPATALIYISSDVAGGFYRIPATFTTAHAFAGTMLSTLPFLFGAWSQVNQKIWQRSLVASAFGAALLGILMSSTRTAFVLALFMVTVGLFLSRLNARNRILSVAVLALVTLAALSNERLQRFKTLSDTEYVKERIAGSVNRSFLEILTDYPMGNGLGGGGTSIPYFLASQVRMPISLENEYARILLEQGLIGLCLWVGFLGWFLSRAPIAFMAHPWASGRKLAWIYCAIGVGTAATGVGMLLSIPQTFLFLLLLGWSATRPAPEGSEAASLNKPYAMSKWASAPVYMR